MRITSSGYLDGLQNFISGLKSATPLSAAKQAAENTAPLPADVRNSILKEALLSIPRTEELLYTPLQRRYGLMDARNRDFLSKRHPEEALSYALVKGVGASDTDLDLIESTYGVRDIHLALESEPDPRIQEMVERYEQAQNQESESEPDTDITV